MRYFIIIFALFFSLPSQAKLTVDISEPILEITTGFTGDTLTLFGTAEPQGDIVILVKGPRDDTAVQRQSDIAGLWITSQSVTFENVPGYYNVASSRPMADIADMPTRIEYRMGINSLTFPTTEDVRPDKYSRFLEALIQNKQLSGLYSLTPDAIVYLNDTLFKTRIYMPANVPLGVYEIEAFLFRNGQLIDRTSHPFEIRQVGLAGNVHNFATDTPFLYGLSVILIAVFSSILGILLLRRE
jgi:uncharacterized protein (TIGR02186 family)